MSDANPCTSCTLRLQPFAAPDGRTPARIVFHGEAPGEKEAQQGTVFVGPAGQLLRETIHESGLALSDILILNSVLCRPPDNRVPTDIEKSACGQYHHELLRQASPQVIVALGNTALETLTGRTGISSLRGTPFQHQGVWIYPTFHPSACLHNPHHKPTFQQDLKQLARWIATLPPWHPAPQPLLSPLIIPGYRALCQKIDAVTTQACQSNDLAAQPQTVALLQQLDVLSERLWRHTFVDDSNHTRHGQYATPPI